MHIKTIATIITRENYSIAVAALPPAFATCGVDVVLGRVLVLNGPVTQRVGSPIRRRYEDYARSAESNCEDRTVNIRDLPTQYVLTFENSWTSKKNFKKQYRIIGSEKLNEKGFVEVELKI